MTALSLLVVFCNWPYALPGVTADDRHRFDHYPTAQVSGYHAFASRHVCWLRDAHLDNTAWFAEAEWCSEAWSKLEQVRESKSRDYQRLVLIELRELIGADAFQAGEMPPPVPIWRFLEIR